MEAHRDAGLGTRDSGEKPKILIAGVGNVLKGDDGFGIALAKRLMVRSDLPSATKIIETGIGGMALIQEAMTGCDALLLLDAYRNGGAPGTLCMLKPELPDLTSLDAHQRRDYFADTHYATPLRALSLLAGMGHLPHTIRVLGCEPECLDRFEMGLSDAVGAALPQAERMALQWLGAYGCAATRSAGSRASVD